MLIILCVCLVLTISGGLLASFADFYDSWSTLGFMTGLTSGIVLFVVAIAWPIQYADSASNIEKYEAVKQTIEYARSAQVSEIERAALTQKIIDINSELASAKYYNKTFIKDSVSDEFANLPYLK